MTEGLASGWSLNWAGVCCSLDPKTGRAEWTCRQKTPLTFMFPPLILQCSIIMLNSLRINNWQRFARVFSFLFFFLQRASNVNMFALHLISFFFTKLQENPTKKVRLHDRRCDINQISTAGLELIKVMLVCVWVGAGGAFARARELVCVCAMETWSEPKKKKKMRHKLYNSRRVATGAALLDFVLSPAKKDYDTCRFNVESARVVL